MVASSWKGRARKGKCQALRRWVTHGPDCHPVPHSQGSRSMAFLWPPHQPHLALPLSHSLFFGHIGCPSVLPDCPPWGLPTRSLHLEFCSLLAATHLSLSAPFHLLGLSLDVLPQNPSILTLMKQPSGPPVPLHSLLEHNTDCIVGLLTDLFS